MANISPLSGDFLTANGSSVALRAMADRLRIDAKHASNSRSFAFIRGWSMVRANEPDFAICNLLSAIPKIENRVMGLHRVCSKQELAPGQVTKIEDPPVAVFNVNGAFFAIRNVCTHQEAPLSEGEVVEEETLVCPWHGACFSLRTGEALTPPAIEPVQTYPVVLREDDIYVELDDR